MTGKTEQMPYVYLLMEAQIAYETFFEMKMRLLENICCASFHSCLYNCMRYSVLISVFVIEMLLFCLTSFTILIYEGIYYKIMNPFSVYSTG